MTSRGRRRELRNQCADLLKIRWKDEAGRSHRELATLDDISPKGLCLKVESPIPPATIITILYPNGQYIGTVKHCDPQMEWYFVGVEFQPGYRWSKEHFEPAHLLDLQLRARQTSK